MPSVLKILLTDGKDHSAESEILRVICFGGGPTDEATIKRIKQNSLCDRFVYMYGQTEASARVSHLYFSTEAHKAPSVGRPIENVTVSVEPGGESGRVGEIRVKGPNVMIGYYRGKIASVQNGWHSTSFLFTRKNALNKLSREE